jgi:hypothetical protein
MSARQPIRLTPLGELVFGILGGVAFMLALAMAFVAVGDFFGIRP